MDLGPSKNLSWKELACHDGTPYPDLWLDRALVLAAEFEEIRKRCEDRPITVLSAYRTDQYNLLVGGAKDSQHLYGRALDLETPFGLSLEAFRAIIKEVALERGILKGLGFYSDRTGTHIDCREAQDLVIWDSFSK